MVNNNDLILLKERFGALISSLHDSGVSNEFITYSFIHFDYFDMFERNDLSSFNNASIMNIVENIYQKEPLMSFSSQPITSYFWAGEAYITIMMNYSVPLKQLFIICPLDKMLSFFPLYHEMHDLEICKEILSLRKEISILKTLRNEANISLRQLSILTNIKQSTLVLYEKNNANLFSASASNINKIKDALNISVSCLLEKSSFIPFTTDLFSNNLFRKQFSSIILTYYGFGESISYAIVEDTMSMKAYKDLLKNNDVIVSLSQSIVGLIYLSSNRLVYKILKDNEMLMLYVQTIKNMSPLVDGLIF